MTRRLSARRLALVAANLKAPARRTVKRIMAIAETGAIVIAATRPSNGGRSPGSNRFGAKSDRDYLALGKGQVVAYQRPIADPSEFALDVIDIITHKQAEPFVSGMRPR